MWGIYPDEQTSGYTITGNVFVNAANSEVNPYMKTVTVSNNDGANPTTIANAGIGAAYRDIKNFSIPTTEVIPAPRLPQKSASVSFGPASLYRVYSLSGRYLGTAGRLSQKTERPISSAGICLVLPANSSGGHFSGGVRKVLIAK
jgi:hypothetical protein